MKKLTQKNKKPLVFLVVFAAISIGVTFAFSHDQSILENLFGIADYKTTVTETFVSPSNWLTCETKEKLITVKNDGAVPIADRVGIAESWKDADGNDLFTTFTDDNGDIQNWAVIDINTADWTRDGYYYYYKEDLAPGATSTPFMTSVTLNCDANLANSPYNDATYTLSATIQTIDAEHRSAWTTGATLLRGGDVNQKLKTIAGTTLDPNDPTWTEDYNIKSIRRATSLPVGFDTSDPAHIISENGSDPIYAWYDNTDDAGIIYLFSNSRTIKAGSNISHLCDHMRALVDAPALADWDMSEAEDYTAMFQGTYALKSLNISDWDMSGAKDIKGIFFEAKALETLDIPDWDTSNIVDMMAAFYGAESLTSLNVSNWDTSSVENMSFIFAYTNSLATVDISNWDTSSVTNMSCMFAGADALTSIDIADWDTSNVTNLFGVFYMATSLKTIDLSKWDTSNVVDSSYMFATAKSLTSINISGWDVSKVTDMTMMFAVGESYAGNGQLQEIIGLENLDVSNVVDMTAMFYGAGNMTAYNISGWDVSKVQSFNHMFCDNFKLVSLDLSRWNTGNVKIAYNMFDDARSLVDFGDISHWDTKNLIDVGGFLNGASSFVGNNGTLDLSGWDTSGLLAAGEMLRATRLTTVDLTGWVFDSATNSNWPGSGEGMYYETGNRSSYKGLSGMFLNMPRLQNVYLTQAGKDSFDAAVERGVDVTKLWEGSPISDFTVVPDPSLP